MFFYPNRLKWIAPAVFAILLAQPSSVNAGVCLGTGVCEVGAAAVGVGSFIFRGTTLVLSLGAATAATAKDKKEDKGKDRPAPDGSGRGRGGRGSYDGPHTGGGPTPPDGDYGDRGRGGGGSYPDGPIDGAGPMVLYAPSKPKDEGMSTGTKVGIALGVIILGKDSKKTDVDVGSALSALVEMGHFSAFQSYVVLNELKARAQRPTKDLDFTEAQAGISSGQKFEDITADFAKAHDLSRDAAFTVLWVAGVVS